MSGSNSQKPYANRQFLTLTPPVGFFLNSDTWTSQIAGDGVVLIGDAAGAADPTDGQSTSLVFRDMRELSGLLLGERDWTAASAEFARRRSAYCQVVRAEDRWYATISAEVGDEADRRRECQALARELDPALGGFALLGEKGPGWAGAGRGSPAAVFRRGPSVKNLRVRVPASRRALR